MLASIAIQAVQYALVLGADALSAAFPSLALLYDRPVLASLQRKDQKSPQELISEVPPIEILGPVAACQGGKPQRPVHVVHSGLPNVTCLIHHEDLVHPGGLHSKIEEHEITDRSGCYTKQLPALTLDKHSASCVQLK